MNAIRQLELQQDSAETVPVAYQPEAGENLTVMWSEVGRYLASNAELTVSSGVGTAGPTECDDYRLNGPLPGEVPIEIGQSAPAFGGSSGATQVVFMSDGGRLR